jgi:hypothetical protein
MTLLEIRMLSTGKGRRIRLVALRQDMEPSGAK